MSSLATVYEKLLKAHTKARVDYLMHLYGVPCKVYKVRKNVFTDVYGKEAGEEIGEGFDLVLVITGDQAVPVDRHSAGTLQEGSVWSTDDRINVGDRVDILRADGRSRRYKVDSPIAGGTFTDVWHRFKIVALGD